MLLHCLKHIWKHGKRVFLHCTPHTLVMNRCLYTKSTYIVIHWLPKPSMDSYDASWGFSLEYYCVRLNCIKYAIQWRIWALPFFVKVLYCLVLPLSSHPQPHTETTSINAVTWWHASNEVLQIIMKNWSALSAVCNLTYFLPPLPVSILSLPPFLYLSSPSLPSPFLQTLFTPACLTMQKYQSSLHRQWQV